MKKIIILATLFTSGSVIAAASVDPMPNPVYIAPTDADIQKLSQILSNLSISRAKDDTKLAEHTKLPVDTIRDTAQEQSLDKYVASGTLAQQQAIHQAAATNPTMNIQAALQQTINGFKSGLFGEYLNASTIAKLRELQSDVVANGVAISAADKAQWLLNESGPSATDNESESVTSIEETLSDINRLMTSDDMSNGALEQLELTRQDLLTQLEQAKQLEENKVVTEDKSQHATAVVSGVVNEPSDQALLDEEVKKLAAIEDDIQKYTLKGTNISSAESVAMGVLIKQREDIEESIKALNQKLKKTDESTTEIN